MAYAQNLACICYAPLVKRHMGVSEAHRRRNRRLRICLDVVIISVRPAPLPAPAGGAVTGGPRPAIRMMPVNLGLCILTHLAASMPSVRVPAVRSPSIGLPGLQRLSGRRVGRRCHYIGGQRAFSLCPLSYAANSSPASWRPPVDRRMHCEAILRDKPFCVSIHGPKWPCGNRALNLSSRRPTASVWSTDRWPRGIARVSAGAGSASGTTLLAT